MTNAAEPLFVDTNVLVYASWRQAPAHTLARDTLSAYIAAGTPLIISRQVIREYLATLNRPQTSMSLPTLIAEVQAFEASMIVCDETSATTAALLALVPQASGARIHDVNIVATMQVAGVQRLLTNNPRHFTPFNNLITIIPLA